MSQNLYYQKFLIYKKIGSLIDQIIEIKSDLNKLNFNQSDLNRIKNLLFLLKFYIMNCINPALK